MGLSDRLKDFGLPVRAFLQGISPHLMSLHGPLSRARSMAASLGLSYLARNTALVPVRKSYMLARLTRIDLGSSSAVAVVDTISRRFAQVCRLTSVIGSP